MSLAKAEFKIVRDVFIPVGKTHLEGELILPREACGIVLFAHGSGSSRHSRRNKYVARTLHDSSMGTLLFDLLTQKEEEEEEKYTRHLRFDIALLAKRLSYVTKLRSDLVDGFISVQGGMFMVAKVQMMPDNQLRERVMREVEWDPEITSTDIAVTVDEAVAALTGFVHSYAEKLAAERAAKRIYGVKGVANDIEVKPGIQLSDPEIARHAVFALETRVNVPDSRLKVTVKKGWLTLDGDVEWQYQKAGAESAVKNLAGIKGLTNNIVIKTRVSPAQVKTRIEEALERSAEVEARRIMVDAVDGTVKLWGNVRSWSEKREAEGAAWKAPGVIKVDNYLTVVP